MSDKQQTVNELAEELDALTIVAGKAVSLDGSLTENDCLVMAERFSFVRVSAGKFHLKIKMISKDCWEVTGQISAKIIQSCVATGDDVAEHAKADISERFVLNYDENDEIDVTDSAVEPLIDGKIPLKEAVFQSLALAANPYPRRNDAPDNFEFGPKVEKRNPFSKLIHLKK